MRLDFWRWFQIKIHFEIIITIINIRNRKIAHIKPVGANNFHNYRDIIMYGISCVICK